MSKGSGILDGEQQELPLFLLDANVDHDVRQCSQAGVSLVKNKKDAGPEVELAGL